VNERVSVAEDDPLVLATPRGAVRDLLGGELRTEWRVVTVAILATLVGSAAIAVGPSMIRLAIDDGLRGGSRSALAGAVVVYGVASVAGGLASGIRTTAMAIGCERFIHRLRVAALQGLLRLDLGRFERLRRGDLLARVTADTEALSGAARWVLPDAVRNVTDLAAALVAVAVLEPTLALLTLVAVPPMAAAGRVLRRRSRVVYPRYRAEIGSVLGRVTETVEGADTVLAHGRGPERLDELTAANRVVAARFLDGTAMRNRFYASITLTRVSATAVVLVAASLLAVDGRITVGTAAAGVLAVSSVFGPLAWFTELLDDVLSAKAALDRVVAAAVVPESATGRQALPARGDLVFDDVDFAYVPGRPVLIGVSLVVPAGARVALVGETGAGKSTLGRLAAGLATPSSGHVRFGGVDLAEARAEDRRRRLLFVLQEAYCLAGTLAENVRLAAPDATDDALLAAADRVGLADWVASHPDGFDRLVGSGGSQLSAGERQLVAILRAAVADPGVVILDEATAILDPAMEAAVGTALDLALRDRTVLVIAHRPETAARCDLQVEISGGRSTVVDDATARLE
jgi:ATP-binding cassette subfamily B protein